MSIFVIKGCTFIKFYYHSIIILPYLEPTLEILSTLGHATALVKFIVFLLVCMSVLSWAVIAWKIKSFIKLTSIIDSIDVATASEEQILASKLKERLGDSLPEQIISDTVSLSTSRIGRCGNIEEISHVVKLIKDSSNAAIYSYKCTIDRFTSTLATIAMISPYIGLLGTVWGLLDAFQNLAGVKVVTFQTVAPSIVEALFATAIGLFVAIPASAGFNIVSKQSSKLIGKLSLINDSLINQVSQIRCANIQDARLKR
ncbi:MotA/TolQ/ExbB proton channel family protein [Vibrio coralliirubri]|uniref:MotA/TolQ/ExbB proton channel family protein n=1 Tax=Vibrio coralliirubri TaxID=1516159 RepID=UPI0022842BC5|nr:MotA/TolQ/ExbB proton channel family protein [Vibrio coralliirubri]MCY9860990.1 MotA/TolQ/ExbB proton channel family protein [Vibrio coralliirubri]